MAPANSGKTAAKDERMALFAAIADAAIGTVATMGMIHGTPLYVVNASQNKPNIMIRATAQDENASFSLTKGDQYTADFTHD
ncbi:hypothetical protein CVT25_013611 [Psilocybe cyanescens]|uniref:Uncharacterized protein n=1 Tax=Psilocybe cyanescens TaxID=93625 RepID=A0A409WT40_PSICY|nr:hypothetical protein CVT25_013611 [Psilocybe cyanescens]